VKIKLTIVAEFDLGKHINPVAYPGCETAKQAAVLEEKAYKECHMSLEDLVSIFKTKTVKFEGIES